MTSGMNLKAQNLLKSRSFGRNVALLAGGTAASQIMTIALSPVITRMYNPKDFGAFSVYSSIFTILLVVVSLRYEVAIPLPKEDQKARTLLTLSLILVVLSSTAGVIICIGGSVIPNQLNRFSPYLWLLPLSLLGAGAYQALSYWAIRTESFDALAKTKLSQGLALNSSQIGLGFLHAGPLGLIIGQIVGQSTGAGSLLKLVYKRQTKPLPRTIRPVTMFDVAREYKNYPLYLTWSSLLNTLSAQLPVILLSNMFGSLVVAWFTLSMRVLQTPMTFFGQVISQVFYSQITDAERRGSLTFTIESVIRRLIVCGLSLCFILFLSGPELFRAAFGVQWATAGLYCRYLAPWLLVVFIASPVSNLVFVLGRQKQELLFQVLLLSFRTSSLFLGWYYKHPDWAILLFSCISTVLWLGYLAWLLRLGGAGVLNTLNFVYRECRKVLLIILPLLLALTFKVSYSVTTIIAVGCTIGAGFRIYLFIRKV